MADENILTNSFNYNPLAVQGTVNFIFYVIIGVGVAAAAFFVIRRIIRIWQYPYAVSVYRRVGDVFIRQEDKASRVTMDGKFYIHYLELNVYSPMIAQEFYYLKKIVTFGFFKQTKLGYDVILDGVTIQPLKRDISGKYSVIEMDQFNFMQSRVKHNHDKFEKQNAFYRMLPIIGAGAVIITFVIGMIFYTKHVEKIAEMVLTKASEESTKILDKATAFMQFTGKGQVIQ